MGTSVKVSELRKLFLDQAKKDYTETVDTIKKMSKAQLLDMMPELKEDEEKEEPAVEEEPVVEDVPEVKEAPTPKPKRTRKKVTTTEPSTSA